MAVNPILDCPMIKPIQIDVFYPIPEGWGMCNPCELMMAQANVSQAPQERGLDEYPAELIEEFQRFSNTIYALAERYHDQVLIKVWDPRSLQGMMKSIRHAVRRYPTFIINGQAKLIGWDTAKLDQQVQSALESRISGI